MANQKILRDVKLAAIHLYEQGILRLHEILECIGFSRCMFLHIRKLYKHTGDVIKPRSAFTGCPRNLNLGDVQYLIELVHHHPDWFLDELAGLLLRNRFVAVHSTTIHRELHCAGISLKKLRKIAKE
ncbi:hypothetical protein DFH29DRAFT_806824 [Suillus ampliporus]|nr:hypothetical protein DFH29DRAFT_806824 [Suillus ampliporus]